MKARAASELYRKLPSVDEVLRLPGVAEQADREGHAVVTDAARGVVARMRDEIKAGHLDEQGIALAIDGIADAVAREIRRSLEPSLRRVINATGVVLHTNLGRAPLAAAALDRIREIAGEYSNLEYQVEAGERGKRDVHVQRLLSRLLGEYMSDVATVVVNNNAAAVLIALNTFGEGGEVIVSRGELVEIGGSFRVPDVMSKSGATLREVGTTNRTRIQDYANAINERTRLLLRVHRSNFQIVGFTEQPSLEELVELGQEKKIPVMEDLGSGALFDLRSVGIEGEPSVGDSLRAGVDVVTYSGDKLLGGPQAGLLSGRAEAIARIRKNPLFRALRVDKLTYAALEATLLAYVRGQHDSIPALRMLRLTPAEIGERAEAVAVQLRGRAPKLKVTVIDGESITGGGAAPGAGLPTRLLAVTSDDKSADELAALLRQHDPPIIARVDADRLVLDLRTVFPAQDDTIVSALAEIAKA
jgi:L-seryl-tRNA(Ser) seleniumtransferase